MLRATLDKSPLSTNLSNTLATAFAESNVTKSSTKKRTPLGFFYFDNRFVINA
jgi:hypothetical protein